MIREINHYFTATRCPFNCFPPLLFPITSSNLHASYGDSLLMPTRFYIHVKVHTCVVQGTCMYLQWCRRDSLLHCRSIQSICTGSLPVMLFSVPSSCLPEGMLRVPDILTVLNKPHLLYRKLCNPGGKMQMCVTFLQHCHSTAAGCSHSACAAFHGRLPMQY